jgi:hypothetical protein
VKKAATTIDTLPLTFLMGFGHCGIDWVHSLLNSHDQILITPVISFFRSWKVLDAERVTTVDDMYRLWHIYIIANIGPDCKNRFKQFLHTDEEANRFFPRFLKILRSRGIAKPDVFWAINEAWSYAKQIQAEDNRIVVSQEHSSWPFEHILELFPHSNILMVIRDPRASIAGSIFQPQERLGFLPDYASNMIMEEWFQGQDMWRKYENHLGARLKCIRNEDLHENLEEHLRDLAGWLGVDFSRKMLQGTFADGKPALADSVYLAPDRKASSGVYGGAPTSYDTYYLPENVKERWMKVLTTRETVMIEYLLKDLFQKFRYERITKNTLISPLVGLVTYLVPRRGIIHEWLRRYPDIEEFDSVVERLSNTPLILRSIWKLTPKPIKFLSVVVHLILNRVIILFFPGNRWRRYDRRLPGVCGKLMDAIEEKVPGK